MKPTIRELEDILSKPDDYYIVKQNADGSLNSETISWWNWIKDEIKYMIWRLQ